MRKKKEINVQIGEQIRQVREESGLTQEQFSEVIGKTPQFVSDMERGVSGISVETLRVICERLSISGDRILFGTCEPPVGRVERLASKFQSMTAEQFQVMEAITTAFLSASNASIGRDRNA